MTLNENPLFHQSTSNRLNSSYLLHWQRLVVLVAVLVARPQVGVQQIQKSQMSLECYLCLR